MVSFDVGMKNLAFCILKSEENKTPEILDWDVLNVITGSELTANNNGNNDCGKPSSLEKVCCSLCKRKAMFVDAATRSRHFCTAHKSTEGFIVATAAHTPEKFLKQSKSALEEFCRTNGITFTAPILKADLVQKNIWPWLQPRLLYKVGQLGSLETVVARPAAPKTMTATYIQMGRFMDTMLRERLLPFRESVCAIIIENQMAERMHMIQGMLTQFCIGFFSAGVVIEFIGPSNKLKPVTRHPDVTTVVIECPEGKGAEGAKANGTEAKCAEGAEAKEKGAETKSAESKEKGAEAKTEAKGAKYRQNKKDGIQRCREWIDREYSQTQWKDLYDRSNKKDDLADSYLQGLWYCLK